MAGLAGDLLMTSLERPVAVARVIEASGRLPLVVAVTLAAFLAHPSGVRVLALVAAEAVLRNLVLQVAAAVAVVAGDAAVYPVQRKARFLLVIELLRLPRLGRMAFLALDAALAVVDVVGLVAGDAFLRCVLVAVAEVAGRARDLRVLVAQREGGLVVVVTHVPPGTVVVAGAAVLAEASLMRLVFPMAAEAVPRDIAVLLAGGVAAAAGDVDVRAVELIVGEVVLELLGDELDDVAGAAEMLGVAGGALRGGDSLHMAVVAALPLDVGGDLLVTIEAQLRLAGAGVGGAAVMAIRALLLELGVRSAHLAGHEERLRVHGLSAPERHEPDQHSDYQQRSPSPLRHVCR